MKMIVVGNGNIMRPQGHLINMFDTVVRVSGFQINGYESLVGTKTDIVSVGRPEKLDPLPPKIWIGNPYGVSAIPEGIMKKAFPDGWESNSNECIKDTYDLCGFDPKVNHPTLGMLTIIMAVNFGSLFYEKPIYVTGFEFGHEGWPRYYYDKKPWKNTPDNHHKPDVERTVLKKLIADGHVEYLHMHDVILLEEDNSERLN